jgi:glycosyltransferase involved in cell wall biosynthesis
MAADGQLQALRLSVLVPVYNERATLRQALARIEAVPISKEIVLVDDGSTDGTRDLLCQIAAEAEGRAPFHDNLRVYYHARNRGKGAALHTAIAAAEGDVVIVQDADLEYNPAEYPRLLAPIADGRADVVYGSRFVGGEGHRVLYFWHYFGNRVITLCSNVFTNLNLTDVETCYKVFRREVIQTMPLEQERFGFEVEVTHRVAKRRLRVYEVGISYDGRTYGEGKKITWKDGVQALWCILKYH